MSDNDEPTGKRLHVMVITPDQKKHRTGMDEDQPANDDYDYRADLGTSGGGVDHNPMSDTQTMRAVRPAKKTKRANKKG